MRTQVWERGHNILGLKYIQDIFKSEKLNYLSFTAEEDNSTISLNAKTSPDIKYSLNGGEWTQWDYNAITLNTGDTVRMKGNNNGFNTSSSSYNQFKMTGKISANGNIMSLLYEDDFEGKLTIPRDYCYYKMFQDCESLTTAPELPAAILTAYCYSEMFNNCSKLNYIKMLANNTRATNCLFNWVSGVASAGTFVKPSNMTLSTGVNGIPEGWTVVNI